MIDSNKVWEEEDFCEKFPEDFTEEDNPPRVLIFTTPALLKQLAYFEKWSQVISNIKFVKLRGLPLCNFNPSKYLNYFSHI